MLYNIPNKLSDVEEILNASEHTSEMKLVFLEHPSSVWSKTLSDPQANYQLMEMTKRIGVSTLSMEQKLQLLKPIKTEDASFLLNAMLQSSFNSAALMCAQNLVTKNSPLTEDQTHYLRAIAEYHLATNSQIDEATIHWIGFAYQPGSHFHRPERATLANEMKVISSLPEGKTPAQYLEGVYKQMAEEGSVKSKIAQDIAKVLTAAGIELPAVQKKPSTLARTFSNFFDRKTASAETALGAQDDFNPAADA